LREKLTDVPEWTKSREKFPWIVIFLSYFHGSRNGRGSALFSMDGMLAAQKFGLAASWLTEKLSGPCAGRTIRRSLPVASFKDLFKSDVAKGVAIGIGIVALSPVVVPVVAKLSRPTARAAARYGNVLYDKGLETFAEMGEILEDFAAEVRAEFVQARQQAAEAAPPSPASVSPTQAPATIPDPD